MLCSNPGFDYKWYRFLILAAVISLSASGALAADEDSLGFKDPAEIGVVRLNITTETRGASESVEINGRRIPNYRPTIIQVFPSTGVVMDGQGHVLTFLGYRWVDIQSHDPRIDILTGNGQKFKGKLIGIDQSVGVAVVLALDAKLQQAPLCTRCEIRDGTTVVAPVGDGAGLMQFEESQILSVASLTGTAKRGGWVLTVNRPLPGVGEPVLDIDHHVLGFIASQKPSNDDPMGIRTVVYPMSHLLGLAEKIITVGGDIPTGWLGVYPEDNRQAPGMGVVIKQIQDDSPAQRAGVAPQDVLIKWNGKDIHDAGQFVELVQNTTIGSKAAIQVLRQGKVLNLTALIEARKPGEPPGKFFFNFPGTISMPGQGDLPDEGAANPPRVGIETVQLTPQLAEFLHVPGQMGLLVLNVDQNMAAAKGGVLAGDVIVSVDGERILDPRVFASHIQSRGWGGRLMLKLLRKGAERTAIIHLPRFTLRKK